MVIKSNNFIWALIYHAFAMPFLIKALVNDIVSWEVFFIIIGLPLFGFLWCGNKHIQFKEEHVVIKYLFRFNYCREILYKDIEVVIFDFYKRFGVIIFQMKEKKRIKIGTVGLTIPDAEKIVRYLQEENINAIIDAPTRWL